MGYELLGGCVMMIHQRALNLRKGYFGVMEVLSLEL
jgi:hypothetical protein